MSDINIDVIIDKTQKLGSVKIKNIYTKPLQPKVNVHLAKNDKSPTIEITNVKEDSQPQAEWTYDETGWADALQVSGISLIRCLDEPGRMTEKDITLHILNTVISALHEYKAALLMPEHVIDKELKEAQEKAARIRAIASKHK